jgi:hypothetical protein
LLCFRFDCCVFLLKSSCVLPLWATILPRRGRN